MKEFKINLSYLSIVNGIIGGVSQKSKQRNFINNTQITSKLEIKVQNKEILIHDTGGSVLSFIHKNSIRLLVKFP
jgi:hypothetical protein